MKFGRDGALSAAGVVLVVLDDRDGGDGGGGAGGELGDERPLRRRHQSGAALGHAHPQPGHRQHLQPQAAQGQRAPPVPSRPQPPRPPRLTVYTFFSPKIKTHSTFFSIYTPFEMIYYILTRLILLLAIDQDICIFHFPTIYFHTTFYYYFYRDVEDFLVV